MAIETSIISTGFNLNINPFNPLVRAIYQCPGIAAGASSSDALALRLLAVESNYYRKAPPTEITGSTDSIQPLMIGVASNSTNLDVSFYTIDPSGGGVLPIYNPYKMSNINISNFDYNLGLLILANEESPTRNFLYLMLTNNDGVNATGPVYVQLCYNCI